MQVWFQGLQSDIQWCKLGRAGNLLEEPEASCRYFYSELTEPQVERAPLFPHCPEFGVLLFPHCPEFGVKLFAPPRDPTVKQTNHDPLSLECPKEL